MNFREEGKLRTEMDLIEAGCVARRTMSEEEESRESIKEMLGNCSGQDLTEFLKRFDDVALTVPRARLSRQIAPKYHEIRETIISGSSVDNLPRPWIWVFGTVGA